MNRQFVLFLLLALALTAFRADKPAYQFFKPNGKKTDYDKLLAEARKADIVLFGELHTNPIAHWLQYELTRDLATNAQQALVLGAEMFEADGQLLLDELLAGAVAEKKFEDDMRLWKNYATDYKPLVGLALEFKLPFVATNIPRRYASKVFTNGLESLQSLSPEAQRYIAPLPIAYPDTLACYKKMLDMPGMGGHNAANLPKAQAAKDATMAHFILKNWAPGKTFVHYHGTYHSDYHQGIAWYLQQARPGLRILTIATVEQATLDSLEAEHETKADFVLVVPKSMTQTQR